MEKQKIIIIGSGPAGYTAAIYAARAKLEPILFEGFYSGPPGGQLMSTTDIENYPGFCDPIQAPKLMESFKCQAERFGTKVLTEDVKTVDLSKSPLKIVGSKTTILTDALIIASGATAKRLDIPGTKDNEFWQKGVTSCAVCDGALPIFKNKDLYVIGGGDTAMEEAIFLTKYAKKVYIVHRRDKLRASKFLSEKVQKHPKIEIIWDSVLKKVEGDDIVKKIILENVKDKKETHVDAGGVFFAIGHTPNTDFVKGQITMDDNGYIKTENTKTNVEGVFAAGDVQDYTYRQAIVAAGSGCMAAMDAERWLLTKGLID